MTVHANKSVTAHEVSNTFHVEYRHYNILQFLYLYKYLLTVFSIPFVQEFQMFPASFSLELNQL